MTVPLDPERVEAAKRRARLAMRNVRHHEQAAARELAKARTLARTWGFSMEDVTPK